MYGEINSLYGESIYDSNHAHDPMRSAALIAATHCNVDYEPQEPEETPEYLYATCKHKEVCKRLHQEQGEGMAYDWCGCDICDNYEYEYGRTLT